MGLSLEDCFPKDLCLPPTAGLVSGSLSLAGRRWGSGQPLGTGEGRKVFRD